MADVSFWTTAQNVARALRLQSPPTDGARPGAQTESPAPAGATFGDVLRQRQQALLPGPQIQQQIMPFEPLGLLASPSGGPAVDETRARLPRADEHLLPVGQAQTAAAKAPAPLGKGNEFGHWDVRPSQRPFFWMSDSELTAKQMATIEKWKASPYNHVWVYDVEPGPANNWAGWGPPPPGWTTRSEIPRADGAYVGKGLPWPPPGEPPTRAS